MSSWIVPLRLVCTNLFPTVYVNISIQPLTSIYPAMVAITDARMIGPANHQNTGLHQEIPPPVAKHLFQTFLAGSFRVHQKRSYHAKP